MDIKSDVELGLVPKSVAAEARGYDPNGVEVARKERVSDLAAIVAAQTPKDGSLSNPAAKGLPDASVNASADQKADGGGRPTVPGDK